MGEVIQIRDHQSRRQREQAEAALRETLTLEQQAIEIMHVALMGCEPTMIGMEPVIYLNIDTAPSEYVAPDQDSA